jgi:NAD(P)-dependent dehydrogenase (short-subunit alcohol dehydrogenase family)
MKDEIFDLSDKVVIVTGGAGLIGEKFCEALYKYRANVIIADINYEKAKKLEDKLGKRAKAHEVDITSVDSVQNMINQILAEHKGINSPVAGNADILLVPDIEAGNVLYKSLVFYGKQPSASVIVGAKVPLVITSRADSSHTKLNSIALGKVMTEYNKI